MTTIIEFPQVADIDGAKLAFVAGGPTPVNPKNRADNLSAREVRARVARLRDAIREVRKVYPRMEMGQLDLLLTVALNPGIRATDLLHGSEDLNLTKGGLYKALQSLSDERSPGSVEGRTSGLDLLTKIPDPADSRAHLLVQTRRGSDLMSNLASKLGD